MSPTGPERPGPQLVTVQFDLSHDISQSCKRASTLTAIDDEERFLARKLSCCHHRPSLWRISIWIVRKTPETRATYFSPTKKRTIIQNSTFFARKLISCMIQGPCVPPPPKLVAIGIFFSQKKNFKNDKLDLKLTSFSSTMAADENDQNRAEFWIWKFFLWNFFLWNFFLWKFFLWKFSLWKFFLWK